MRRWIFYHSDEYTLVSQGISDMHCMSDEYLAEDLENEYRRSRNLRPAAGLCHAAAEPGTGELAAGTAIMFFSTKSVKTQSDGAV